MIKKYFVMSTFFLVLLLSGCTQNTEEKIALNADDLITMEELDDYMFRDDIQYVDLRNFDARFNSGFIYSFENIPFFDYLEYRALDRMNTYDFKPEHILDEEEIYRLFDKDKAIFLFANGCVLSGYMKDVLDYLGYEKVFMIGAFGDYNGEHLVLGDGAYFLGNSFSVSHYDETSKLTYFFSGTYELDRAITSLRIDIVDENNISLRSPNYDENIDYNKQLSLLENFIVSDYVTITELYNLLTSSEQNQYDSIPDYTIGFDEGLISTINKLSVK